MTAVVRVFRTVLQAVVSLAGSVPLAVYLPARWAAVASAGLVVAVAVLHNILDAAGFFAKITPAKYQPAIADGADVLSRLEAAAQALEHSLQPAAAVPPSSPGQP